ncbi:3'-5' exonuclease [Burkholderia cepacia]|uniref:3'-5' exonuclease n=1 Tax=Burkholderia cepacia TaxID=292 RepID=UPI00157687C2|nr:3'-5' exonuclease [Burkholderia cepacia]
MRIITGFDLETTGLDWNDGHRIIEVAAVLYDLDVGTRLGQYVQRVNPQRPIDEKAQAVHKITFDMLTSEPTWEQVAPAVSTILARTNYVVAHNGFGFDFPFVTHELQRVGVAVPEITGIDTMLEARWATPFGKLPNLGELCFACGVHYDPSQAHAALYDVERMMEAYFAARKMGNFFGPHALEVAA